MKLLFMLMIALLLGNLKASSQIDIKDSSTVRLDKTTAIKVAQDLIRYDELKIRTDLLQEKVRVYENIVAEKDSLLESKKATITRQERMINNHVTIGNELQLRLFKAQKDVRKQKVLKWVAIAGAVVVGVFAIK